MKRHSNIPKQLDTKISTYYYFQIIVHLTTRRPVLVAKLRNPRTWYSTCNKKKY